MNDLEKLSPRELDALVAEKVMEAAICRCPHRARFPLLAGSCLNCGIARTADYSTDDSAVRLVRDRIVELGLNYQFLEALDRTLRLNDHGMLLKHGTFELMNTTPRQQCIAALKAQASQTAGSTKKGE